MMKNTELSLSLIGWVVVALASGCSRADGSQGGLFGADGGSNDPVPVEVATLSTGPIESTLRFSANLEAEKQVQVLARTQGQVVQLLVEEGAVVNKGAILLRLEADQQRSTLARTETELAQALRLLDTQKQLHEQEVVSDEVLETAEFDVKRLRITRDDAARNLSYTTVRAVIAGTVTLRQVKLGDHVNPNQHLFDITDFDSIVAKVFVPEKKLLSLKKGLRARIFSTSSDKMLREGTVDRVAPVVDPRSGTVKVTITIPNTASLKPGAFVDVELVTDKHETAVLLPRRALVYDNDVPHVFMVGKDSRAKRVRVRLILENRDFVESQKGFKVGDRVVVAGQVGLKDNARVDAKDAAEPAQ